PHRSGADAGRPERHPGIPRQPGAGDDAPRRRRHGRDPVLQMTDAPFSRRSTVSSSIPQGAPSDLQEHLARLQQLDLLTRIDRPIDKDSELHPLARWQFQGGLHETERRAFLFTNVVGAKGEAYDIPVVVGGLAASPAIYAAGLGVPVDEIGDVWVKAMAQP